MKQKYQSILVAVQKENTGEIITNPPVDYEFQSNDHLIVIAPDRPQL
jgi:K+/H+ antiporter YhaU regulatory subunit KhtT